MKKFITLLSVFSIFISSMAFASEEGVHAATGWMAIAIAAGIAVAAVAGTLSQAKIASAALEGIARNPNAADKVFVPMILGLAFVESLVLFTWVLMFLMNQNLLA